MSTKAVDLAVALHYDGTAAPQVVAKGQGELAERIVAKAQEHAVPLHRDPQLAKLLVQIPLGEEIPRELYVAVAEVIAFAYWLSGKGLNHDSQ
ncbi:EscU/YscU/HrcU family type III secretion system export apparatus switch protein [Methylothermus subterraneus]